MTELEATRDVVKIRLKVAVRDTEVFAVDAIKAIGEISIDECTKAIIDLFSERMHGIKEWEREK